MHFMHFNHLTTAINRGAVVEKVCEYMAFKQYYSTAAPNVEIPVNEFMERIPPEVALELYVFWFIDFVSHLRAAIWVTGCWRQITSKVSSQYIDFAPLPTLKLCLV